MSRHDPVVAGPVRIALRIADAPLADRLALILADVPGIALVAEGEGVDATIASAASLEPAEDDPLTPREREVLGLLVEGAPNKAIARRLGISPHTAKLHVRSPIDKLDATGRTDAVAHAARLGVIHL